MIYGGEMRWLTGRRYSRIEMVAFALMVASATILLVGACQKKSPKTEIPKSLPHDTGEEDSTDQPCLQEHP
jgi:hypothetical protein